MTKAPPNFPPNHIILFIGGLLTPALVDIGSSISVLSLSLCKRLRKVLLPSKGSVPRSAFNGVSVPIEAAVGRLLVDGILYPAEFRVLPESSHDIILGSDFFSENEAVIDFIPNEILLSEETCYDIAEYSGSPKLLVFLDTVIMPQSLSYVRLAASVPGSSDMLIEPQKGALEKKGLLAPFSLTRMEQGHVLLPIRNSTLGMGVLPQGFVAASFQSSSVSEVASVDSFFSNSSPPIAMDPADIDRKLSEHH